MTDFVNFILSYLNRALFLAVPAVLLCGLVLFAAARFFKKKGRSFPWGKAILWLALLGYCIVLLVVTIGRTGVGGWRDMNLHLFRAWKEAWNTFTQKDWLNILLNIAMFLPLGFLLPLLGKGFARWHWTLGAGFLTSLAIEAVQLAARRGLADVDDLFCNTLGCFAGYFLVMALRSLWSRKWKSALGHSLCLLAILVGIASPFLAYEIQELGNLPHAPAYRVNTDGADWNMLCELEDTAATLPLYRLPTPTKAECEQIGRQVLSSLGGGEIDVWYYNDEVYLRCGNHCVSVYYLDGSYNYWFFREDTPAADISPGYLREKLRAAGIDLPEEAELTREEDGWYCFTVSAIRTGETLLDGTVRCQLSSDGTFLALNNHLNSFTFHRDAAIISPQAAAERVMAGWLTSGDWFESDQPKEMELRSCILSYQVDTKGFYQPVYLFEVAALDTNYGETVIIPAVE